MQFYVPRTTYVMYSNMYTCMWYTRTSIEFMKIFIIYVTLYMYPVPVPVPYYYYYMYYYYMTCTCMYLWYLYLLPVLCGHTCCRVDALQTCTRIMTQTFTFTCGHTCCVHITHTTYFNRLLFVHFATFFSAHLRLFSLTAEERIRFGAVVWYGAFFEVS